MYRYIHMCICFVFVIYICVMLYSSVLTFLYHCNLWLLKIKTLFCLEYWEIIFCNKKSWMKQLYNELVFSKIIIIFLIKTHINLILCVNFNLNLKLFTWMLHQVLIQYETNKYNYKSILYKIINILNMG